MSTLAIVVILFGIGVIAGVLLVLQGKRNGAEKARRRAQLSSELDGHQQEASAHTSRAEDLRPQAQAHREEAAQHLEEAQKLEAQADRSKRFASRHEAEADQRREELEQL